MPRKPLRMKMLSPRRRKTCEHGERDALSLKSPVVQSKANRRASEAVPAPTRFERMGVRTLRCAGTSGNELEEGDTWAPTLADHTVLTELGIPYGRRLLGERSHRSSLSWGKPSTWRCALRGAGDVPVGERDDWSDVVNPVPHLDPKGRGKISMVRKGR